MATTPKFDESFKNLNPEQREAVECLDGPLLVIAGPGTGKTQLLSLRAANILAKCDVAPRNILCLTYTEAGAEAMRKRLIELIGRDAYGIEVSTFHGFASSIRSRYPEFFTRPATDTLVTSLHQQEIFDRFLKSLPFVSPLGGGSPDMPAQNIGKMISFVSKAKRSGLDYDALGAIAQQNIDAAAWLTEHSELLTLACERASAALAERFEEEVERACGMAPTSLTHPIECPTGTYVPYILALRDTVRRTELIDEKGKSSGYTKVRDAFFGGSNSQGRTFKIAEQSERLKTACDVARRYQSELDQHHLYDYDDMIGDFVDAVEHNDALRQVLQDTYTYIQVDEFQDTNGAQMRIIELLCDGVDVPNIMAVGDDIGPSCVFRVPRSSAPTSLQPSSRPGALCSRPTIAPRPPSLSLVKLSHGKLNIASTPARISQSKPSSLRVIRSTLARTSTPAKLKNTPLSLRVLGSGLMITISMNAKIPMKELQSSLPSTPPCAR